MSRIRTECGGGLVEALIAISLLSIVLAAMVSVLLQQQRFYVVAHDASETVAVLERIDAVVSPDLQPLNAAAGDLIHAAPDSLALRVYRGVYAVCDKRLTTEVQITVRGLSEGVPVRVDSALFYSPGTRASGADDHWKAVRIQSVKTGICPDSTPGWTAIVPDLNGQLNEVPIGAPVRVFHRASYWLVTKNGDWVLKTNALGGSPTVVSGALAPADSAASAVLQFAYLDVEGNPTATLADIARIEVEVRALGDVPLKRGGDPLGKDRNLAVRLRNAGY